jgi:hypothetical protein
MQIGSSGAIDGQLIDVPTGLGSGLSFCTRTDQVAVRRVAQAEMYGKRFLRKLSLDANFGYHP